MLEQRMETYDQIAATLVARYDTLYYIDIETSTYVEISSTDEYKRLNVPATGNDFFSESRRSIRKYVHPEDQEWVMSIHYKDAMLRNLKNANVFSHSWRLVVNGQVQYIRHSEIMARDGAHIIVCIENIDEEVKAGLLGSDSRGRDATYTQIAESLASHFDLIYYIECDISHYTVFSAHQRYGGLEVQEEGEDFFAAATENVDRMIHVEDRERIRSFLNRDNMISQLEDCRQLTEDYRMIVDDGKVQYTRMMVRYSADKSHFIICIENRDEEVRREKEHLHALSRANDLARRDTLTGARNRNAYRETEKVLQKKISEKSVEPFGLLLCDINGLKIINDTEGHRAGDEYIRTSCALVRRIFSHSTVYRFGGDEFVVLLKGQDYLNREELLSALRSQVDEHVRIGEGPVFATGMAEFQNITDCFVEDVFNRADSRMYREKERLKNQKLLMESYSMKERANLRRITEDRRKMLDALFKALDVVADGTYVFLCDMKYDFSKWSKNAVDTFGLPSEYMYGAGDIWENRIHPEDREAYHKGIDEIFSGQAAGHDMQYRAMRTTGIYDVCTCRGSVIRDSDGEPDYFAGTIRNHAEQSHIDALTGLRNQYGFFEDLEGYIKRNTSINVVLVGISRFSEINELYGYHFGNRVLQLFARKIFQTTGNTGHSYRIDGTMFAVISNTLSTQEMRALYKGFRDFFREQFQVDDKRILLEVNCGAIRVDSFDIDSQTVYACLNFAYEESKVRRQGEMVEFHNALNEENRQRLEKLHAIRGSIMHDYQGFYLLFQPVVDAETEKLTGAEALLRWKNDTYGMVPPDLFIPVLESDPMFPDLGEWIIRESVLAAKQVLTQHPDFVINVNLSYTQLEKPDFTDRVLRILDDLEFPPNHLCMELTERCRLLDMQILKNVTSVLRSRGILVALDDFGTGFSSVSLMKEVPIDIIKIDRGFVQRIENSEIEQAMLNSFATLASIFDAGVCVEGVETEGMRDILRRYHVKSFQGYYYAKPLPLDQFLLWDDER